MNKLYFYCTLFLFFFKSDSVSCQLFVGNNNFIYNKNSVVFVKGNINLNGANSNFYLRNQGQLFQGTTSTSTNTGTGKLSVFQEGTVNNFAYNFWCSPVGNASLLSGNENFGITMLHLPITTTSSIPANLITGYNGVSSNGSLSISSHWIWKFLSSNTYSQWIQSGADTNIAAGEGFTMKGTSGTDNTSVGESTLNNPGSGQRYDFRGKPNDGNITVNVANNNFTLTGNPYPSALHVNSFLLDGLNSSCTGIAYYWEQDKTVNSHLLANYVGGYGSYSPISLASNGIYVPATFNTYNSDGSLNTIGPSSGLTIQRKYAPIGQGFMVQGSSNGSLTIQNKDRSYRLEGNFSQFERNASVNNNIGNELNNSSDPIDDQIAQIRLNTTINNQYTTQLAVAFMSFATDSIDRGVDAKSPVADTVPNDVYLFLNNDKYVIQGLNFDVEKRIPIGIKSTNTNSFLFNASTIINFDNSQNIFIYDALDNTYHDIKNGSYEVTLPTGVFNNRFEMTFMDNQLSNEEVVNNNFDVFQNNTIKKLRISNPNTVDISSVNLYDSNGKEIFKKSIYEIKENYEFDTSSFSTGTYIIHIVTKKNILKTQKIIVINE